MTFIKGTTKEVQSYFQNHPTYVEDEIVYYEGFDLMRPSFFENMEDTGYPEYGCRHLLSLNEQKEVVGVLKYKRYSIPGHHFVPEEEANEVESYIAIRFIDVKQSARKQGVALSLVQEFSSMLHEDELIVGGKATTKGREANIHTWFERELTQKYYISEVDLIEEWEEENEDW